MHRSPRRRPSQSFRDIVPWLSLAIVAQFLVSPTFALAGEAADPAKPDSATTLTTALIAVIGVLLTAVISAGVAWFTARNTTRSEHVKRQTELALQISQIVSTKDGEAQTAAMRRYAVAIVKVVNPPDHKQYGLVYFVPMNSRITIGRADDNDIVLKDKELWLSRWHCGFIADQRNVWIDDYESKNGTKVQGEKIQASRLLKDGDKIHIGPYELVFRLIQENRILSQ